MRIALRLLDPRLPGWGFPRWGSAASAGLDLHACLDAPLILRPQAPAVLVPAGFALAIRDPEWCGLICPRSGLGHREGLVLGNGVGVIDADYEGPILVSVWNRNPAVPTEGGAQADTSADIAIAPGDRIAQLVLTRTIRPTFEIAEAFAPNDAGARGEGGFGSTGRR